jgi:MbtH protein
MLKNSNRFGQTILMLAVATTWLLGGISRTTAQEEREDTTKYQVVVNHEEQLSIWAVDKPLPIGWKYAGKAGTKQECLDYIKEYWTSMRQQSLRNRMEEEEQALKEKTEENSQPPSAPDRSKEKSLLEKLSGGDHPIHVGFADGAVNMKDALSRGYVNIQFTETDTGIIGQMLTLRMDLDKEACNFDKVDFEKGEGPVHLEGSVTLEGRKVRCIADFAVAKLYGTGHLVGD